MDFLLRLLATMAGLWVSTLLIPSIYVEDSLSTGETVLVFAVIALIFTIVNSLIKPIIQVLAFPLYILTFGLFALVTNSAMFALTGWLSTTVGAPMHTGGFWSCVAGALITSVVASIVSGVMGVKREG